MKPLSSQTSALDSAGASVSAQRPRLLLAVHSFSNSYLHLPGFLDEAGFEVDLIARPGNPILASRSVRRRWSVPGDDSEFAAQVDARLSSGAYAACQLCDEPALLALYRRPACGPRSPLLPLGDPELIAGVGRKAAFQKWCEKHGLPTPRTALVEDWADLERVLTGFGTSCYLKGSTGSGGQTVRLIRSAADLAAARAPLSGHGPWLVQENVEGPTCGAQFAAHRGRLLGWFAIYKRIVLGDGRGPTLVGEICAPPGLEELCARVCAAGGLSGLHGFDFMLAADGRALLIDPHLGRCTPMIHFGSLGGVNLAAAWRDAVLGRDREPERPARTGTRFLKYPEVLQHIIEGGPLTAWRELRPSLGRLHVGWGRRKEWRALTLVSAQVIWEQSRNRLGALRRRLLRRAP